MSLTLSDMLLFKSKYRLAQQYHVEQLWLEVFAGALRQQADFDEAIFEACEECEFF